MKNKKPKHQINKLDKIFSSLGFEDSPTIESINDAIIIAEEQGNVEYLKETTYEKCGEKNIYTTEKIANAAKKRLMSRGKKLCIYKCNECNGWHLTSTRH